MSESTKCTPGPSTNVVAGGLAAIASASDSPAATYTDPSGAYGSEAGADCTVEAMFPPGVPTAESDTNPADVPVPGVVDPRANEPGKESDAGCVDESRPSDSVQDATTREQMSRAQAARADRADAEAARRLSPRDRRRRVMRTNRLECMAASAVAPDDLDSLAL